MPTYIYACNNCTDGEYERNVPMSERDQQVCKNCLNPLDRKIRFSGLTWAPTAGGYR